tara:strand:+ start:721 stop:1464 length:744 start_codon:yes stop_codon:yes gene_type:complete
MNEKTVTVVLNGYKRNHTLSEQVNALQNQSVKVTDIMYWQNSAPNVGYDLSSLEQAQAHIAVSNINYGVWARFAHALNARTDYVCVIDDDTIPGDMWIENCLNTYETHPGLLGTIGLRFQNKSYAVRSEDRIGWDTNNNVTEKVDIVGHNWFFARDLLSVLWRELPPIDHSFLVGEDIHFSHMIQKYTEYGTYVPPHPSDNKRLWGSLKATQYGGDTNATANFAVPMMHDYLMGCIDRGFKLLGDVE